MFLDLQWSCDQNQNKLKKHCVPKSSLRYLIGWIVYLGRGIHQSLWTTSCFLYFLAIFSEFFQRLLFNQCLKNMRPHYKTVLFNISLLFWTLSLKICRNLCKLCPKSSIFLSQSLRYLTSHLEIQLFNVMEICAVMYWCWSGRGKIHQ